MNKKYILIALMFCLVFPIVAADDIVPKYYVKVNMPFNLTVACDFNGAPCPINTNCNFTITRPDSSYVVNLQSATLISGGTILYSLNAGQNNVNGLHYVSMNCISSTAGNQSTTFYYKITPTGDNRGMNWLLVFGLGGLILLMIAYITNNRYFGFISGCLILAAGVYIMVYGFSDTTDIYTRTISYVLIGIGAIITIIAGYDIVGSIANGESPKSEDEE